MQQHLLMVWNPLLEPRTIQVHVESLRRTTTDSYVWWGRIYAGTKELTAATVQEKWQYVFDINKRARRSQSPLVMFVTDFTSLHALQIDHVQPGPTWPTDERDRMP